IVEGEGGKLEVLTNKTGTWERDDTLSFADLVMPEQRLGDWDVTRIEPKPLAARATDRRHVDAGDIEYFTEESIGPNRERTPEGFLVCFDVPAARIGEMVY